MIQPVILAGGSGTRLWPLSRVDYPKQFLNLLGEHSMLQSTLKRLSALEVRNSITICNEEHRFVVAEQLREIGENSTIILEPFGRNTAPAVALAAFKAEREALLLVLPADHLIEDQQAFTKAINEAIPLADAGNLVTFGVVPKSAHIGYGYIKPGLPNGNGFVVDLFEEKPSIDTATSFFESSEYLWNSGIFLFKSDTYLRELESLQPDIYESCQRAISKAVVDQDFLRVDKDEFESCNAKSIDYAVMEKTDKSVVVPIDAAWSDVGTWKSLWNASSKDDNENAILGDVLIHDVSSSYLRSDDKLVSVIGLNNIVVISTKDSVLVASKDRAEEVGIFVENLKNASRFEWKHHREVYRPWGKYDSIDVGLRDQVKRITVNPGAKLSLQMHHHRAEHWTIVSGTAKVTVKDETFLLTENQSTYIPLGSIHSLENPGKVVLELIEVQTGTYLGEDDIIRFTDKYGRS